MPHATLIMLLLLCVILVQCAIQSTSHISRSSAHNSAIKRVSEPDLADQDGGFKSLKLSVVSWNMAEKLPVDKDCEFIKGYRNNDLVAFGIQELEDIRPRRSEGHRSRKWSSIQQRFLGKTFKCVSRHKMGGLMISVFAKKKALCSIQGVQVIDVACGVGNVLTNKGAVCVVLRMKDKTIALVNSHLAAHQKHVQGRNADYARIVDAVVDTTYSQWKHRTSSGTVVNKAVRAPTRTSGAMTGRSARAQQAKSAGSTGTSSVRRTNIAKLSPIVRKNKRSSKPRSVRDIPVPTVSPRDSSRTDLPFDAVIFFGDLNYRIDLPRLEIERVHHRLVKNACMGNTNRTVSVDYNSAGSIAGTVTVGDDAVLTAMKTKFDNRYLRYATSPRRVLLEQQLDRVLLFDQLARQRGIGAVLQNFQEGTIRFPPTYKYDKHEDRFDSSSKQRCPAWTDRILYYSRPAASVRSEKEVGDTSSSSRARPTGADGLPTAEQVATGLPEQSSAEDTCNPSKPAEGSNSGGVLKLVDYYSIDARTSDHRPVCADFSLYL